MTDHMTRGHCCEPAQEDRIALKRLVEARATVVGFRRDRVIVQTGRESACSACEIATNCGSSSLHKMLGKADTRLELAHEGDLAIGQAVTLSVPESGLLTAAMLTYLLPLAGLILATVVAASTGASEDMTILAAAIGLVIGFLAARRVASMPGLITRLLPIRIEAR
ncbi:SoxR reducing system RseC family protein [Martelella endophytica]|uniref:SoxR reducing system RseC family protein n=1 Tax=Martelella endophytica TaxID=1486262 RepID=UPI000696E67A|nr:SoxR reducing system RseC family protein [Martelella endophytica]